MVELPLLSHYFLMTNKYLSSEYAATDFSFPYVQALRGEDPKQCGYFIPLSQAEKAGWKNLETTEMTEYTYNNGQTEVGILLQKPRMILTPICQLGAFDRKASQDEETLVVLGEWERKYRDDDNVGNFQIYLVMFFNENKQPLHDIPLKLVGKGAHQATLSIQWQEFCTEVSRCHAKATQQRFVPRGAKYNALCLFQPQIVRRSVGVKIKSQACCIDGYLKPTVTTWEDFFIGTNEELGDMAIEMLNPRPRLLLAVPTTGTLFVPPSDSVATLQVNKLSPAAENSQVDRTDAIDIVSTSPIEDKAVLVEECIPF
jgi:Family of unknown function (DUF5895)